MNRRICSAASVIVVGTFLALGVHQVADRLSSKAFAEPASFAKPAHIDDYVSFDKEFKSIRSNRSSDDDVDLFTFDTFKEDEIAAITPGVGDEENGVEYTSTFRHVQRNHPEWPIRFQNGKIYIPVNVTRFITVKGGGRRSVIEQHSKQLTGPRKEYFEMMVKSMMLMSDEELAEVTKTTKKQIDDKTAQQRLQTSLYNLKQILEEFPETPAAETTKEILALPNVAELLKSMPEDIASDEFIDFTEEEFPTLETDNPFDRNSSFDDDLQLDPSS